MKLKYKFVCKDIGIPKSNFVTYGKRKRDIVKRVQSHLVNLGLSEKEVQSPEIARKIKSSIKKSQYA